MDQLSISTLPFAILYAETHFRFFPFFPSLLYRKEPEILFDLPRRINPGNNIPILLIINDIAEFPVKVIEVSIAINAVGQKTQIFSFDPNDAKIAHPLQQNQLAFVFEIPNDAVPRGELFVNAKVIIGRGKKRITVLNDNFPTSSKQAFRTVVADHDLPGHNNCIYGDLHVHSNYSQSHVEFGPPVKTISTLAHSYGLDFVSITDHSYDLCCAVDNYLQPDPSLKRFALFSQEMSSDNNGSTIVIRGEEVSCLNSKGKVVHLCALGTSKYIPGSLDGARRNRKKDKQLSISEAVKEIHNQGGIAFAAHPGAQAKLLQSVLLSRGEWEDPDLTTGVNAIQAANGDFFLMWERGKALWIKMLQQGIRVPLLGGNDAHGDFNRYRAIEKPFVSIRENFDRYFGLIKTGIYGKPSTSQKIIEYLNSGKTFVTNGPFVTLSRSQDPNDSVISNKAYAGDHLNIIGISTPEFGRIAKVKLLGCKIGSTEEKTLFSKFYSDSFEKVIEELDLSNYERPSYLRAEIFVVTKDKQISFAATSACFLEL